jgi:hypothetical protein
MDGREYEERSDQEVTITSTLCDISAVHLNLSSK